MTTNSRIALLSVSDPRGIADLGRALGKAGWRILATTGTRAGLSEAGIASGEIPGAFGGRLKTLRTEILAGVLAGRKDLPDLAAFGAEPIDLVCVNFYGSDEIDIGGVTLVRAAAKNHDRVAVLSHPDDYPEAIAALGAGGISDDLRARLAQRAYARVLAYDARILERSFAPRAFDGTPAAARYGENPHQAAAILPTGLDGLLRAEQIQGESLSYNNHFDCDAAAELAAELDALGPAAVFVKHRSPCGAAIAPTIAEAVRLAREADATSAYGGALAVSRPMDFAAAEAIGGLFLEGIVAPGYDADARERLGHRKKGRVLAWPGLAETRARWDVRTLRGAVFIQEAPGAIGEMTDRTRPATPDERLGAAFAGCVVRAAASNAVVLAVATAGDAPRAVTTGIGLGRTSRVDAAEGAAAAAARRGPHPTWATATVAASDAFFPFPDGLDILVRAGATAVAAPLGSIRDAEVIAAAEKADIAFLALERRLFRH